MASLGKDLTLQPGDQIGIMREGPSGVFGEGYALFQGAPDAMLVDRLLGPGQTDADAATSTPLNDTEFVTPDDWVKMRNLNAFEPAQTWDIPSARFPTVGALLDYLGDRFLMGAQTVRVTGVVQETGAWTIHSQMNLIDINGATTVTMPVGSVHETFTGMSAAQIDADTEATRATIKTLMPNRLEWATPVAMTFAGPTRAPAFNNIMLDNVALNYTNGASAVFFGVVVYNGNAALAAVFTINSGRYRLQNISVLSRGEAIFANGEGFIGGIGIIRSPLSAIRMDRAELSIGLLAGARVTGGLQAIGGSHVSSITIRSANTDRPILRNSNIQPTLTTGGKLRFLQLTAAGYPLLHIQNYGPGPAMFAMSEIITHFDLRADFTFEATSGNCISLNSGATVNLPSIASFINNGASAHIRVVDCARVTFAVGSIISPPAYTWTGGPALNVQVTGSVNQIALRGVTLPQGINRAIGVLNADGTFVSA